MQEGWHGAEVRIGGCHLMCRRRHLTTVQNDEDGNFDFEIPPLWNYASSSSGAMNDNDASIFMSSIEDWRNGFRRSDSREGLYLVNILCSMGGEK
ncbi:hypothetical protein AVEN_181687-1 [Araneus ventricosus]|uniref:Uncharacterized protein n=1 Tax=Araneus ventricosus TaxID=182803 RepID=A0A4Y2MP81_ARAVE|nr:hypothetical protein AVEN_181687-1 [Araneus ventricosus]